MRSYRDSEIFQLMNRGDIISTKLAECGQAINESIIINDKIISLDAFKKTYRETIVNLVINAIKKREIIIIYPQVDKRFPANIPFLKTKINGKPVSVVDLSKYANINLDDGGAIETVECSVEKLYGVLVPAYLDLKLFYNTVALPSEAIKHLAIMWAKMFNKVLISRRVFVGNNEKYEAFMYFAMKFFMSYYLQCPEALSDKIAIDYLDGVKSKYIDFVETNLQTKMIDLYKDWTTFAHSMFSNDVTNIMSFNTSGITMDEKLYLQLFDSSMGKDGAYLALWSVPYFIYCIFVTFIKGNILNDRAWDDIVRKDGKMVPKMMDSLYKEL